MTKLFVHDDHNLLIQATDSIQEILKRNNNFNQISIFPNAIYITRNFFEKSTHGKDIEEALNKLQDKLENEKLLETYY